MEIGTTPLRHLWLVYKIWSHSGLIWYVSAQNIEVERFVKLRNLGVWPWLISGKDDLFSVFWVREQVRGMFYDWNSYMVCVREVSNEFWASPGITGTKAWFSCLKFRWGWQQFRWGRQNFAEGGGGGAYHVNLVAEVLQKVLQSVGPTSEAYIFWSTWNFEMIQKRKL